MHSEVVAKGKGGFKDYCRPYVRVVVSAVGCFPILALMPTFKPQLLPSESIF